MEALQQLRAGVPLVANFAENYAYRFAREFEYFLRIERQRLGLIPIRPGFGESRPDRSFMSESVEFRTEFDRVLVNTQEELATEARLLPKNIRRVNFLRDRLLDVYCACGEYPAEIEIVNTGVLTLIGRCARHLAPR